MIFRLKTLGSAVLCLLLAFAPLPLHAEDGLSLPEQEIKAGLLYNFLKYIEWPPAALVRSPEKIVICLYGDDPFDGYLQPLAGRSVNQREIEIHTIHDLKDVDGCHLLYINASEQGNWSALHRALDNKSVLTVSDFRNFTPSGGMIGFGLKDNRIVVSLNLDAVTAAQLHVEDRLLRLVTITHSVSPSGGS